VPIIARALIAGASLFYGEVKTVKLRFNPEIAKILEETV